MTGPTPSADHQIDPGGVRVSVILPTYRRQDLLPRAIRSVLDQTLTSWELLVVDDEPSDDTRRVVASFDDPRVRYLPHAENRGLSAARNTGIRAARGEYVAFLDDDDAFLERKLELQSRVLDRTEESLGVVSCFEEIRRLDGTTTSRAVRLDGSVHAALLRNDLVRMQLLLVRRGCFDHVGLFDERLRHHEDYDMTLRLSRAYRFATVPELLIRIFTTPASLSTNVENRIRALETIMATHPEFREQRRIEARWERRLARHHAEQGSRREWRRHMIRSIRAYPLGLSSWLVLGAGLVLGPRGHLGLSRVLGRTARAVRAIRR